MNENGANLIRSSWFVLLIFVALPGITHANDSEIAEQFVESQYKESDTGMVSDSEHGTLISYLRVEGESDKILVHWLFQVANFWQHRITLLHVTDNSYTVLSSLAFKGEVEAVRFEGNKLVVELLTYAKNDPRCCPTVYSTSEYLLLDGRIVSQE